MEKEKPVELALCKQSKKSLCQKRLFLRGLFIFISFFSLFLSDLQIFIYPMIDF